MIATKDICLRNMVLVFFTDLKLLVLRPPSNRDSENIFNGCVNYYHRHWLFRLFHAIGSPAMMSIHDIVVLTYHKRYCEFFEDGIIGVANELIHTLPTNLTLRRTQLLRLPS